MNSELALVSEFSWLQARVPSLSWFPVRVGFHSQPYGNMYSLPLSKSLAPLSFPLFCFAYNFFYLYLLFSVCQALLKKKRCLKRLLFHFTTHSCYLISLYRHHVPVSIPFHLWLVLRFLFSAVCGLQPHVVCSGKLQGPVAACAEGLPTGTVLILGVRRVAAVFRFVHCFSRVGAVLALTLPAPILSLTRRL